VAVAAVDNDILFKGACYGLLGELIAAIPATPAGIGILGAAKYVVSSKLRNAILACGVDQPLRDLQNSLEFAEVLEPTIEEQRYAAELEASAQQSQLQFDTGESQLCAIAIGRAIPWFVTGDKRAIRALERLLVGREEAKMFASKLVCLEQLFLRLIAGQNADAVRSAVCAEPMIDKALAACFSCHSAEVKPESWSEGLTSYIRDLRGSAPTLLAP
jgi:hypothetical protein